MLVPGGGVQPSLVRVTGGRRALGSGSLYLECSYALDVIRYDA